MTDQTDTDALVARAEATRLRIKAEVIANPPAHIEVVALRQQAAAQAAQIAALTERLGENRGLNVPETCDARGDEGKCLICGRPRDQHDIGTGLATCRGIAVPTYTPAAPDPTSVQKTHISPEAAPRDMDTSGYAEVGAAPGEVVEVLQAADAALRNHACHGGVSAPCRRAMYQCQLECGKDAGDALLMVEAAIRALNGGS